MANFSTALRASVPALLSPSKSAIKIAKKNNVFNFEIFFLRKKNQKKSSSVFKQSQNVDELMEEFSKF